MQVNAVCFCNSYIATVIVVPTNANAPLILQCFLSLSMFRYTAGIIGKETCDQSGKSGTNAYKVPCRASILVTAGSLP